MSHGHSHGQVVLDADIAKSGNRKLPKHGMVQPGTAGVRVTVRTFFLTNEV